MFVSENTWNTISYANPDGILATSRSSLTGQRPTLVFPAKLEVQWRPLKKNHGHVRVV